MNLSLVMSSWNSGTHFSAAVLSEFVASPEIEYKDMNEYKYIEYLSTHERGGKEQRILNSLSSNDKLYKKYNLHFLSTSINNTKVIGLMLSRACDWTLSVSPTFSSPNSCLAEVSTWLFQGGNSGGKRRVASSWHAVP